MRVTVVRQGWSFRDTRVHRFIILKWEHTHLFQTATGGGVEVSFGLLQAKVSNLAVYLGSRLLLYHLNKLLIKNSMFEEDVN